MAEEQKPKYLDFDQYIRQGEPDRKERAETWRVAIGLQAVDGLTTSEYLQDTARRNIEGEISIDEARELIQTYYRSKQNREPDEDEKQPNLAEQPCTGHTDTGQAQDKYRTSTGQAEADHPSSTPQVPHKYPTSWGDVTGNTKRLVCTIGTEELSVNELLARLGLKDRKNFSALFLSPAVGFGFVQPLYPDSPRHPRQRYLLTAKGLLLFDSLNGSAR